MKTVTGEPMIWLRDLDVAVEPAPDGRTRARHRAATTTPTPAARSRRSPAPRCCVLGARRQRRRRRCSTNAAGIAGFSTPADVAPRDIVVSVHHPDYNPRHLRLDGTNLVVDLRRALYGKSVTGDQWTGMSL